MKKFLTCLIFFSIAFSAFCQRVISPVEGSFSNKQCLVLNLREGEEAFYSYSDSFLNSDPMEAGFAYDGPVFIDAGGRVNLKIAVASENGIERYEIKYSVFEELNPFEAGTEEFAFVDSIHTQKILSCTGRQFIQIPSSLKFCLGDGEKPMIAGTTLSISPENKLYRFIPCVVTDGNLKWRFVINLHGDSNGIYVPLADVPFKITDWYTFTFTGNDEQNRFIWNVDDEYWTADSQPVFLDRSVPHTIRWQSVAYEDGNKVETYVLPPKPQLVREYSKRTAIFTIVGDKGYSMSVLSGGSEGENHESTGVYQRLVFDAFEGDSLDGYATFALFCNGVYQGNLFSEYKIDKQPPLPPSFDSGESGFYARSDVNIKIRAEEDSQIFYAVAGPYELVNGSYNENSPELENIKTSGFRPYDSSDILFKAGEDCAVFYKISAYAVDSSGNMSDIADFKLIIDEFNYFVDFGSAAKNPDGSRGKPLNNIEQVLAVANSSKIAHFYVTGLFAFPEGNTVITSNCSFTGNSRARINFPAGAFVTVKNSSIEFINCVIQKEYLGGKKSDSRLFEFENAAASFVDCDIYGTFSESGTCFALEKSLLTFKDSVVTLKAMDYACGISAAASEVNVKGGRFACVGRTSVTFSVADSSLEILDSNCSISSHMGRIVESTASNLRIAGNHFSADFDVKPRGKNPAVYMDSKSLPLEISNNIEDGF